jgi:Terpene cyclase DEP1
MSSRLFTLVLVIVGFGVLSALALMEVGYLGLIEPHFQSWGAAQVFVDLVILALLACVWMVDDARARGLSAWPFVVITLIAGSFGPLLYLAARELRSRGARSRSEIRAQ